ncbi:hypothetical protein SSPO_013070 [Streptomyces antimycoticus]|uniref:Uncharacterized protein n=1 Tax=Streptomyces antimycoticus TaxID=68175 RepID=A0A499UNE9_9ACTN|nr:hypothetical protein SSPO_013070 [Streptomyces antimycoticus]
MSSPVAFSAAGGGAAAGRTGGGARPKLEHAYLELRTPPPGGGLTPGGPCGRIDFQFNPKELSLTKAAAWKRTPAKGRRARGRPSTRGRSPAS